MGIVKALEDLPIFKSIQSIDVQQIGQALITLFQPYKEISETIKANIDYYLPALEKLCEISATHKAVNNLGQNQYVLRKKVSIELVEEVNTAGKSYVIDGAIEKYIENDDFVKETIDLIRNGMAHNLTFEQGVSALYRNEYNSAILTFTIVLDRMLSEGSEQIKNVHIKPRVEAIHQRIKERGDFYIDDLEAEDYVLLLTYKDALDSFGSDSDFKKEEPELLNRHWIVHGRSNREYTRLDCIKVLNMIYGTIRMTELGKRDHEDSNSTDNHNVDSGIEQINE
ncbi:hypothetical protein JRC49_01795 [Clostridiales bacterium FE2011]|nr:hypothetical protein JRC49_01795 [Clostridiales bacterium FE2011]